MASDQVVVGYSHIMDALRGDPQRALQGAASAFESMSAEPETDLAFIAHFREAIQALEREEKSPRVLSSPQNAMAAALQSHIAGEALKFSRVEQGTAGALEAKFDTTDWSGWVKSFLTWWKGLHTHPFPRPSPDPLIVKEGIRMAVLGDWGTGMYGAPVCSGSIENDTRGFQIVMHLGDVYYSGTDDEERNRCLSLWPKVAGARNFSLNSNHEMYTGGHGYFEVLLKDPRFAQFQVSSYFALENRYFVMICLDTAYAEHDIADPQGAWLDQMFARADGRKVILFSHHQPFSLLDAQGPKLQVKLAKFLSARKIFAWYWGHEHRCVVYDRHPAWNFYGRCVGHSGMPYFRGGVSSLPPAPGAQPCWKRLDAKPFAPGAIVLDGPNPFVTDDPPKYRPHWHLFLQFSDAKLAGRIHDPKGP